MVFVIDENYLAITALVTVGWQGLFSIVATTFKSDKVTDLVRNVTIYVLREFASKLLDFKIQKF
jgi:hypothetical protein